MEGRNNVTLVVVKVFFMLKYIVHCPNEELIYAPRKAFKIDVLQPVYQQIALKKGIVSFGTPI